MSETATAPNVDRPSFKGRSRWAGVGLIGFTLGGGMAIFVGGTPYFELTTANDSPLYNAVLVAAF